MKIYYSCGKTVYYYIYRRPARSLGAVLLSLMLWLPIIWLFIQC